MIIGLNGPPFAFPNPLIMIVIANAIPMDTEIFFFGSAFFNNNQPNSKLRSQIGTIPPIAAYITFCSKAYFHLSVCCGSIISISSGFFVRHHVSENG